MPDTPPPAPVAHAAFAGWIGVARRPIDPPQDIYARNWGAAKHDQAEGRHRSLTLTALTLQETPDAPPLVLIAADLGWWRGAETEWLVRGAALKALELDPARLIFNLSHTHAGPALCLDLPDAPGGGRVRPYLEQVAAMTVEAAREALRSAAPGELAWTTGSCDLACNRDLRDPERARIVCGLNPAAPADTTVLVGRVAGADGRVRATLVNYACHPVTLAWQNTRLSPDYVGAMRELVETHTQAPCLFLQGCSGELAPAQEYTGDTAVADANGRRLGFAALAALEGMLPPGEELAYGGVVESGAPLAVWSRRPREVSRTLAACVVETDLRIKEEYPPAAEIRRAYEACEDRVQRERLRRKLAVRKSMGDGTAARMPLWVWRAGDAVFCGVPHEAYSRLQTELRRRFAPRAVVAMNLVNGGLGYLAPAELYGEDLYQVWQSPFAAGGLEQVLEACASGIGALTRA
ncbi:MAG: hypothetical protein KIS92_09560 [Planctomycetota bacterium]|nr:hypothetical protein [Planctomycetota bacterium]